MDPISTSLLFAKALGMYLTIVGIAILLHPKRFRTWYNKIITDDFHFLFGSTLALFIGVFIVALHNVWVFNWPIIITLIGYWSMFKGAGFLIIPNFVKVFKPFIDAKTLTYRFSGIVWIIIGLFLLYHGYVV
ncbi:MAG TPA: hypothetical protein VGP47_02305 [Parachlamydiaceae bacterium]|nr:hypothetical protein [Parachlamydiaceae bacterium]